MSHLEAFLSYMRGSIARRTLTRLAVRVALVIVVITGAAYFHIVSVVTEQSLGQLEKYISERGERERGIFALAEANHRVLKQELLQRLKDYGDGDPKDRFDRLFVRFPDGTTRTRLEGFNGQKEAFGFIGRQVTIDADIRRRVIVFDELSNAYGPPWHHQLQNLYFTAPENILVGYWPEVPTWAHDVAPDLFMPDEEYVWAADKKHNPSRETVWTGLFFDKTSELWMVSVETPVDIGQRQIATIGHDIPLNEILERTINDTLEGAHNFIMRPDGRLIAHPEWTARIKAAGGNLDINATGSEYLKRAHALITNRAPGQRIIDNSESGEYFAVTKIKEPGWFFVTVYPKNLVSAIAFRTAQIILLLGFAALLIEILIFYRVLKKDISDPLAALAGAADQIADGDLSVRLKAQYDDELGHFAKSFNIMTEAVKSRSSELLESEERYRDIADIASDWFWELDENLRFTYLSDRFFELSGLAKEDMIGKAREETYLDPQDEQVRKNLEELKARRPFKNHEHTRVCPDGRLFHASGSGTPIFDEHGAFKGYRGVGTDITARKLTEEALRNSEEQFRRIFEGAGVGMASNGLDGRFIRVNKAFCEMLGYSEKELLEKTVIDVTYEEDVPATLAARKGSISEGRHLDSIEKRFVTKDGRVIWGLLNRSLVKDDDGQPDHFESQIQDITERKKAEAALRQSEERLQGAIESLQEGFALFDADDRIVAFNDIFRQMNPAAPEFLEKGLRFEEIIRHNIKKGGIIDALGREEAFFRERIEQHRNPGPPILRHQSGDRWQIIREIRTPEGGIAATFFDITDLKRAEEAAKKSEARLAEILAIAPEAVITIGADMNIQLFNQGAERIFGYRAGEVVGRSLDMLLPDRFRAQHGKHIEGFDRSPGTYRLMDQRQEIAGLRKDGGEFPASASVSKGEIDGEKIFTVMLHDVSERNQAAEERRLALEEARRANAAKSEFLAAMSHELRTPLNAILGFADIISHQYVGPVDEKYQEYAEDIHTSGEHLLSLINDVLDISSIEAGKRTLTKEDLIIAELVAESVEIVAHETKKKNIDLTTDMAEGLPPLHADRRAVRQILLNLLTNSIKFTPEGGRVTVSAKATNKRTTFKVADTGIGIAADKIPELTNPFTRGERDPHKTVDGWGLGLAITKSLVDLHEGKLEIKSKLGAGTTVTVTLPTG